EVVLAPKRLVPSGEALYEVPRLRHEHNAIFLYQDQETCAWTDAELFARFLGNHNLILAAQRYGSRHVRLVKRFGHGTLPPAWRGRTLKRAWRRRTPVRMASLKFTFGFGLISPNSAR